MKEHKHKNLIIAWANGEIIQEYHRFYGWIDSFNPLWAYDLNYRIKPKEDPYAELKKADSEGKKIQIVNSDGVWHDYDNNNFDWSFPVERYRIKPERKLVPYTWEDREQLRGKWVKYILSDRKLEGLIDSVQHHGVNVSGVFYSYEQFLKEYKFLNDSPCGKHIEQ